MIFLGFPKITTRCARKAQHFSDIVTKNQLRLGLTLTLLMTRIGVADNPHNTVAAHNFTVAADLLY
jgi:hypothetical protein